MEKPKVGDTLYSLNIGNEARRGREQKLTRVTVTKVGRKYFTCTKDGSQREREYLIDNWAEKTNYCQNSKLYKSKITWLNEKETSSICKKIYQTFDYGHNPLKIPLEKLRAIAEIINTTEAN